MSNPIPVNISGVPTQVDSGSTVSATAAASDAGQVVYIWSLNGVVQPLTGSFPFRGLVQSHAPAPTASTWRR